MNEKAASGLGVVVNQAKFIAKEQENILWENAFFIGKENGKILCFNLVWVFGIQFALRTGTSKCGVRKLLFGFRYVSVAHRSSPWTEVL